MEDKDGGTVDESYGEGGKQFPLLSFTLTCSWGRFPCLNFGSFLTALNSPTEPKSKAIDQCLLILDGNGNEMAVCVNSQTSTFSHLCVKNPVANIVCNNASFSS